MLSAIGSKGRAKPLKCTLINSAEVLDALRANESLKTIPRGQYIPNSEEQTVWSSIVALWAGINAAPRTLVCNVSLLCMVSPASSNQSFMGHSPIEGTLNG